MHDDSHLRFWMEENRGCCSASSEPVHRQSSCIVVKLSPQLRLRSLFLELIWQLDPCFLVTSGVEVWFLHVDEHHPSSLQVLALAASRELPPRTRRVPSLHAAAASPQTRGPSVLLVLPAPHKLLSFAVLFRSVDRLRRGRGFAASRHRFLQRTELEHLQCLDHVLKLFPSPPVAHGTQDPTPVLLLQLACHLLPPRPDLPR